MRKNLFDSRTSLSPTAKIAIENYCYTAKILSRPEAELSFQYVVEELQLCMSAKHEPTGMTRKEVMKLNLFPVQFLYKFVHIRRLTGRAVKQTVEYIRNRR